MNTDPWRNTYRGEHNDDLPGWFYIAEDRGLPYWTHWPIYIVMATATLLAAVFSILVVWPIIRLMEAASGRWGK